jgi:hypothetical protein
MPATIQGAQLRIAYKNPCRVASTADIDLATGTLLSIDGVTTVAGDRVLVKNQSDPTEGGIYLAATGAWTRAEDFDSNTNDEDQITAGLAVYIQEGTANGGATYTLTTTGTITVGSTSLTFAQQIPTVNQSNVYYVGKHGSDSNDGKSPENAFLTIGQALTDIAANETPSTTNRFEVHIVDAGRYAETVVLVDWVSLVGSTATVAGTVTMKDGSILKLGRIDSSSTGITFDNSADEGFAWVDEILTSGVNPGINHQNGDFYLTVKRIVASSTGNGINVFGAGTGNLVLNAGEIVVATGDCLRLGGNTTSISGTVAKMTDTGAGGGINMTATTGKIDLHVGLLDCTTTYTVGASNTLNLFVSDLIGSAGTVTGTANVVEASAASGAASALDQTNAVYVSKAGSDSNDGTDATAPKLTIGSAITQAATMSPTAANRISIIVQDAGTYNEQNLTISTYRDLIAPSATIEHDGTTVAPIIGMAGDEGQVVRVHKLVASGTAAFGGVNYTGTNQGHLYVDEIESLSTNGSSYGVLVGGARRLIFQIGKITIQNGVGVYRQNVGSGSYSGDVDEIEITGTGNGIYTYSAAFADFRIGRIYDAGSGTGIQIQGGGSSVVSAFVGEIDCNTTYTVAASTTLNLFVGTLTGSAGTVSGTLNLTQAGVDLGALTQTNAVYVSKAGNDSNAGTDASAPKLTIGSAMTAATGLSPTSANRITVVVQDAGDYNESVTIPAYVSLDAPTAQITPSGNAVIMGLESSINIYKVTSGGTPIDCQGAGRAWVKAAWLQCTGISGTHGGVKTSNASAIAYVDVDYITGSRTGVIVAVAGGQIHGLVGEIDTTQSGVYANVDGLINLNIGKLDGSLGVTAGSTAIINLTVEDFSSTAQGVANNTSVVSVLASRATGTAATGAGTFNLVTAVISLPVTQTNVVYVSKAGSDSDGGLTEETPKLTIGSAITVASGLTPTTTNRIEIRIMDAGRYSENVTLPDYVSLNGPAASLLQGAASTTLTMGIESTVRLFYTNGGNYNALDFAAAGKGWAYISEIEITGISFSPAGVTVSNASADAFIEIGRLSYNTRVGIAVTAAGNLRGRVGLLTGSDDALVMSAAGQADLSIDSLVSTASEAITLSVTGAVANLTIRDFASTGDQVNVAAGATVNIIASDVSGTTGTVTGTYNLTEAGVVAGIGGSTGATDNALLTADGTGGSTLQATAITVFNDNITLPTSKQVNWSANTYVQGASGSAGDLTGAAWDDIFFISNHAGTQNIVTWDNLGQFRIQKGSDTDFRFHQTGYFQAINQTITAASTYGALSGHTRLSFSDYDADGVLVAGFNSGDSINGRIYPLTGVWNNLLLHADQLTGSANTIYVSQASLFWMSAQPNDTAQIAISDGTTTRVYEFDNNASITGDVTVTIGASLSDTLTNLATAISGDGSGLWEAVHVTTSLANIHASASAGGVVIYRTTQPTVGEDRVYDTGTTFSSGSPRIVDFGDDPDYRRASDSAAAIVLPTGGDPSARNFGMGKRYNTSDIRTGEVFPSLLDSKITMSDQFGGGWNSVSLGASASGDVVGPGSATDNAIARFDLTTGKLIQNSAVTIADTSGYMTFPDLARILWGAGNSYITATGTASTGDLEIHAGDDINLYPGNASLEASFQAGGGLLMREQTNPPNPAPGFGAYSVRDDTPSVPVFSDDQAVPIDYNLLSWSPVKRPCALATTGNITLSGEQTIDGTLTSTSRVLVWNQTTGSENGIYTTAAGAWSRTADFDDAAKDHVEAGVEVYVAAGDLYGRTRFTLVTTGALTIGSTSLEFIPEGGLARTDAASTVAIAASTAFTSGTFVVSSTITMRDHSEIAVFFDPEAIGSNTSVDLVIFWSDDGTTIPFATDDNIQQSDFDIVNQSDGSFNPKPYTARFTTAGGELATGAKKHIVFPKGGGACRIGVKGDSATGTFGVRVQRLTN